MYPGTRFASRWIAANTLAWITAIGIFWLLDELLSYSRHLNPAEPGWPSALAGLIVRGGGAVVFVATQLAVLPRRFGLSTAWIAAGGLTWLVWLYTVPFMPGYWSMATAGALTGVVQGFLLRHRASRRALWVPANAAGCVLGFMAGLHVGFWIYGKTWWLFGWWDLWAFLAGGAVLGLVAGAISAPVLVTMLRDHARGSH
jgi:hypothetical protein